MFFILFIFFSLTTSKLYYLLTAHINYCNFMIFDKNEDSLNAWKTQMHMYEKNKRTKKPFGKIPTEVMRVTHQDMKNRECRFNPVLQTYKLQDDQHKANREFENRRAKSLVNHLKNTMKYEKNFDIVNLKSNFPSEQKAPEKKLGPIRNVYDVISNQKLPDFYFEKRQLKLPVEKTKKLLGKHKKEFDIVTNVYQENHEKKMEQEEQQRVDSITQKYWKTHDFDPVYGKYYDANKEEQFQQQRIEKQKVHGRDADKHLPPSYKYRQPFIVDYTKPLPETLKMLDQQKANANKKYQVKYIVLDQYQKRNLQEEQKQQKILKNHVHFGRVLDEKAKEFDIVTNKAYKPSRAEDLYGKKVNIESWDQLMKQASKAPPKAAIKTGGFS